MQEMPANKASKTIKAASLRALKGPWYFSTKVLVVLTEYLKIVCSIKVIHPGSLPSFGSSYRLLVAKNLGQFRCFQQFSALTRSW